MQTEIIVIDQFYESPDTVRAYALQEKFYYPYQSHAEIAQGALIQWRSSYFKPAHECPFKSSSALIEKLEQATGEKIDQSYWNLSFPNDENQMLLPDYTKMARGCRWNCCFHLKHIRLDEGQGIHNHITDTWNEVGHNGWVGIVYLTPNAPKTSGLTTWKNRFGHDTEWMSDAERWEKIDQFSNIYNRLILHRGHIPHCGGTGFADSIEEGRLFQTFFFKTLDAHPSDGLKITL
ncbi:MAG: hypothetical protein KI790_20010 [Cyclobacteriaceae bacterium]|nr:hypothetical protein [Cyclobacteriaceae bacterium HetDA_MAG_MS6]